MIPGALFVSVTTLIRFTEGVAIFSFFVVGGEGASVVLVVPAEFWSMVLRTYATFLNDI
jgi:hypothetical protein